MRASGGDDAVERVFVDQEFASNEDQVWNSAVVEDWFEYAASEPQRKQFRKVARSLSAHKAKREAHVEDMKEEMSSALASIHKKSGREIAGSPSRYPTPADAAMYEKSGVWSCPVCFYTQQKLWTSTCEMCGSANPATLADAKQGETSVVWPHIKPLIDDAANVAVMSPKRAAAFASDIAGRGNRQGAFEESLAGTRVVDGWWIIVPTVGNVINNILSCASMLNTLHLIINTHIITYYNCMMYPLFPFLIFFC